MSQAEVAPAATSEGQASDFKLEVVVLPVTDVDRAKRFYDWYADYMVRERAGDQLPL